MQKSLGKLAIFGLACSPSLAFAYLDPGTGSALIQGLIAAIAAIGVSLKLFWHRVVAFFGGRNTEKSNPDEAEPESKSSN